MPSALRTIPKRGFQKQNNNIDILIFAYILVIVLKRDLNYLGRFYNRLTVMMLSFKKSYTFTSQADNLVCMSFPSYMIPSFTSEIARLVSHNWLHIQGQCHVKDHLP